MFEANVLAFSKAFNFVLLYYVIFLYLYQETFLFVTIINVHMLL